MKKKLNLTTLVKLESKYSSNHPISQNALKNMINIVLHVNDTDELGLSHSVNYELAFNTLVDLGVIEQCDGPVQQLNS